MNAGNIYVALDIGSFTTKLIAAKVKEDKQTPIGVVSVPTKGVFRNKVKDSNLLTETIKNAVFKMKTEFQINVKSIGLVIPSNDFLFLQHQNEMVFDEPTLIQGCHLKDLELDMYEKVNTSNENISVVTIIPKKFVLDNSLESIFPIRINASSILFQADVYGVSKENLYPYLGPIEEAGLKVIHMLPSVIASSYGALMKDEVISGTCILDIGADSTSLTIFSNRQVKFLEIVDFGSHNLTKIIESKGNLSYNEAELLKKLLMSSIDFTNENNINQSILTVFNRKNIPEIVARSIVSEMIDEMNKFLSQVSGIISENELSSKFGYYVFSGGGSEIYSFEKIAKSFLEKECYVSKPKYEGVRHSMYTNAVGMIDFLSLMEAIFNEKYDMADAYIEELDFLSSNSDEDVKENILDDIDIDLNESNIKKSKSSDSNTNENETYNFFDTFFEKNN